MKPFTICLMLLSLIVTYFALDILNKMEHSKECAATKERLARINLHKHIYIDRGIYENTTAPLEDFLETCNNN